MILSKYTTELRYICENAAGLSESVGYKSLNEVIQAAIPKVFDFDFPIFDENYRNVLCTKILKHYYTREIGEETVGLWKLRLDTRMNEIMPYYNQLYRSELLEFDPLFDTHVTTTFERTNSDTITKNETDVEDRDSTRNTDKGGSEGVEATGTETGNSSANRTSTSSRSATEEGSGTKDANNTTTTDMTRTNVGDSTDAYSDTPQGSLQNVLELEYLTNARRIDQNETRNDAGTVTNDVDEDSTYSSESSETGNATDADTGEYSVDTTNNRERSYEETGSDVYKEDLTITRTANNTNTTTEDYVQTVVGKNAGMSYSRLLTEFRNTILNIDMQVIDSLNDLFMCIW